MSTPITTLEEARKHRYDKTGYSEGNPYREGQCCEEIREKGRWPRYYQCTKPNGHGPAGLYCKLHDPERVAAKRAKRDAKWRAAFNANMERSSWEAECRRALLGIPAPEAALKEAREALDELLRRSEVATIHDPKCPKWERAVASCGCGLDAIHARAQRALALLTPQEGAK